MHRVRMQHDHRARRTLQLLDSQRLLPARCRRRPLGRRAWVYELDMWDNWPSGREWPSFELETHPVARRLTSRVPRPLSERCAEKGANGITAWPVAGKQAGPDRILPGFRRSFNRPVTT